MTTASLELSACCRRSRPRRPRRARRCRRSRRRPSLEDLPIIQDAGNPASAVEQPLGGDLDFLMPDDINVGRGRPAPAPVDDIPLMDFEAPAAPARAASEPLRVETEPVFDIPASPMDGVAVGAESLAEEPEPAPEPIVARRSSTIKAAQSVEVLQALVDADPEDHGLRRRLAEALLEAGDREGGLRELETAMLGFERADDLDAASSLVDEIVRLNPASVRHHQKRVEYAFRTQRARHA